MLRWLLTKKHAGYFEGTVYCVLQYQLDLEKALREGRTPPQPPPGISKEALLMYHDVMAMMKRMEVREGVSMSVRCECGCDQGGGLDHC